MQSLTTTVASTFHLTAEERRRAAEAYDLCAVLRHPGDDAAVEIQNSHINRVYAKPRKMSFF